MKNDKNHNCFNVSDEYLIIWNQFTFFYTENGQIYFRTKENGPKHKITYFTESRHSNPITLLNKDEIVAKIEKCQ